MENNPTFHLQNIVKDRNSTVDFDGPLSLILLLLQKNKIEIRDIKVSEILDQYLAILDGMEKMDLEVTSDFVQMASYLILIKTKELLSSTEEISELELLMESLEQLKAKDMLSQIKSSCQFFSDQYKTGALIFSKNPEPISQQSLEYSYIHDPSELLTALSSVFINTKEKVVDTVEIEKAMPKKITYSVKNKSRQIISKLRLRDISINELYSDCTSTSEVVATFVSVLELCAHGNITVTFSSDGKGYELSLSDSNVDEIIEKLELDYE